MYSYHHEPFNNTHSVKFLSYWCLNDILLVGSSVFESYSGSGPRSGGGGGGGGGGSSGGGSKLGVKKERTDEETKQALDYLLRDDVGQVVYLHLERNYCIQGYFHCVIFALLQLQTDLPCLEFRPETVVFQQW